MIRLFTPNNFRTCDKRYWRTKNEQWSEGSLMALYWELLTWWAWSRAQREVVNGDVSSVAVSSYSLKCYLELLKEIHWTNLYARWLQHWGQWVALGQDTSLSHCSSTPRSINGYRGTVGETWNVFGEVTCGGLVSYPGDGFYLSCLMRILPYHVHSRKRYSYPGSKPLVAFIATCTEHCFKTTDDHIQSTNGWTIHMVEELKAHIPAELQ